MKRVRSNAEPPGEPRDLYEYLKAHDPQFDGRWFVGVTSTGIYCRPVCPVRVPKFENCTFHLHAARAEKAGFRPCLVCRPELAPGDAKVDAISKLATLALRRIEDGALNGSDVEALAMELGVTSRHLRRAMEREFGVTPVELAQTQRLLHAKQLLTESDMSVTDIAFAAGFDSVRRFNALFKSRYRLSPRTMRRRIQDSGPLPSVAAEDDAMTFRLDYRPPFNWPMMAAFLGARAIPGVEAVISNAYVRTVQIGDVTGWLAVQPQPVRGRKRPVNALSVTISRSLQPACVSVLTKMKTVFDTRAPIADIERRLGGDPILKDAVKRSSGMRLPGAFNGFELLLRAILGQQVSVKGATTLAGRMAAKFGVPIQTPWEDLSYLTPTAARIAQASIDEIAKIGMPGKRAATISIVAKAVASGELRLEPGADPELVREQLIEVPGIGDWTASYVAMRGLAWPDALPVGDLGIKKALGLTKAADIEARTEHWRPWRAYGAIYLWLSLSGG